MIDSTRKILLDRLSSEPVHAEWGPSPVELWKSKSSPSWEGDISNFRRLRISGGTINPPDRPFDTSQEPYPNEVFLRRVYNTFMLLINLAKLELHSWVTCRSFFKYVREFNSKKFRKFSILDNYFNDISIRMSYYSHRIRKIKSDKPVIMEIGSGYGALSSYLKGDYSRFIIVDLIENLILATEFLSEAGINFGTISDLSNENVSVLLLSGGDIQHLDRVDIVVNTMSMQHMTNQNLKYYFGQIERLHPRYIYLVNRNVKRDPTDIEIQNYPIPFRYNRSTTNAIYSKNYSEVLLACTDC